MMNFDIDCLRTFFLVSETMSFSRTADRVFRSQSTVSQQISKLEEQVGAQLFVRRKGRILKLTHEGSRLIQFAGEILRLNDEAYAEISGSELAGFVRLGVPLDFFGRDFTRWLAAFKRQHPLLALEVESDQSENLAKRAAQGAFDLAFFKQEASANHENVALREQLVWVTNKNFVPSRTGSVPLVLFPEGCTYRRVAIEGLRRKARPWNLSFVSPSFECLRTAIDEGLGITVLARALVTPEMQIIDHAAGLPKLPAVDLVYSRAPEGKRREIDELSDFLIGCLNEAMLPLAPASIMAPALV